MSQLSGEVIKLSALREAAKKELSNLIDAAITGGDKSKAIFVEPSLIDPLKYSGITTDIFKKERGIEAILPIQERVEYVQVRNLLFFVRPSPSMMRLVAGNVIAYSQRISRLSVFVYFVPKKTVMCEHILDVEYKLSDKVAQYQTGEYELDLIPVDDDVLSMEMDSCFKELYLDGDMTILHMIAKSIMKLQTVFGTIPTIRAKGRLANKVLQIVKRINHEVGSDFTADVPPEVEALYIVDRSVDFLTPFVTQLTYEGLIEELYGINTGHFDPPFDLAAPEAQQTQARERKVPLNASDRMFGEIRDKNFTQVGGILHAKSLWVKQSYERRKDVQQLKELKEFMKGLPEMQELHRLIGVHTNIAFAVGKRTQAAEFRKQVSIEQCIIQQVEEKEVIEFIDDLINRGDSLKRVLRLLCMMSCVNGGMKPKLYDQFKESLMLSYGIPQIIAALHCLDRVGLLVRQDSKSPFSILRKACRLWADALDEKHPTDVAFAYSGYAPLLLRVVEGLFETNWQFNDAVENATGEKGELMAEAEVPSNLRVVIVFVIGGMTHAEISGVRFLGSSKAEQTGEAPRHCIVATTNITSGNKLLESLLPFALR